MLARSAPASRSRLSGLRRWGLGLALGLVAVAPLACEEPISCYDNACTGVFSWYAEGEGGGALQPGTYAFEVELDGTLVGFSCIIADTRGDSECDTPVVLEGDGDFPELSVDLRGVMEGYQDPSDQVGRIMFSASENVPGGMSGPADVRITATRDGQPVVDETYEVTYERDETFHGDERCGFCDGTDTRTVEITE
jgi:hypothetical protein